MQGNSHQSGACVLPNHGCFAGLPVPGMFPPMKQVFSPIGMCLVTPIVIVLDIWTHLATLVTVVTLKV